MTFAELLLVENLILVFFKLLNFGIIIGLIGYAIHKYAVPMLRESRDAAIAFFQQLTNKHDQRLKEYEGVLNQIAQDEAEYARLKERLMRWRADIDEKKAREHAEQSGRIEAARKRIEIQQQTIMENRLYARIMPQAIKHARQQMSKEFGSKEKQQQMFEKIISQLAKAK